MLMRPQAIINQKFKQVLKVLHVLVKDGQTHRKETKDIAPIA